MRTRTFQGCSNFKIKTVTALIGLALTSGSVFAAVSTASPIAGTYIITSEKTCFGSSARSTPTPAAFTYNTPDGSASGLVLVAPGTTVSESKSTTTYTMKVNPTNGTITVTEGVSHAVPIYSGVTTAYYVGSYGPFTGSGTFAYSSPNPYIDVNLQTQSTSADGLTQFLATNYLYRFATEDNGKTIFTKADRGSIILINNVTAGTYSDSHCTGSALGHRVSKSF